MTRRRNERWKMLFTKVLKYTMSSNILPIKIFNEIYERLSEYKWTERQVECMLSAFDESYATTIRKDIGN